MLSLGVLVVSLGGRKSSARPARHPEVARWVCICTCIEFFGAYNNLQKEIFALFGQTGVVNLLGKETNDYGNTGIADLGSGFRGGSDRATVVDPLETHDAGEMREQASGRILEFPPRTGS
ncbi:hypothetical protein [Nocardia gipuzkoensis]